MTPDETRHSIQDIVTRLIEKSTALREEARRIESETREVEALVAFTLAKLERRAREPESLGEEWSPSDSLGGERESAPATAGV